MPLVGSECRFVAAVLSLVWIGMGLEKIILTAGTLLDRYFLALALARCSLGALVLILTGISTFLACYFLILEE